MAYQKTRSHSIAGIDDHYNIEVADASEEIADEVHLMHHTKHTMQVIGNDSEVCLESIL